MAIAKALICASGMICLMALLGGLGVTPVNRFISVIPYPDNNSRSLLHSNERQRPLTGNHTNESALSSMRPLVVWFARRSRRRSDYRVS